MIEALLTILGGATGGGIIGLLGTGIQAMLRWGEAKQAAAREIELRRLDIEEKRLEIEQAEKLAAVQLETARMQAGAAQAAAETTADRDIQLASYANDRAAYGIGPQHWLPAMLLGFVDVVRGLMRPAITVYTLGLMTWIGVTMHAVSGGNIPNAADLWTQVVSGIISLTSTTVTWWFGSRQIRG